MKSKNIHDIVSENGTPTKVIVTKINAEGKEFQDWIISSGLESKSIKFGNYSLDFVYVPANFAFVHVHTGTQFIAVKSHEDKIVFVIKRRSKDGFIESGERVFLPVRIFDPFNYDLINHSLLIKLI